MGSHQRLYQSLVYCKYEITILNYMSRGLAKKGNQDTWPGKHEECLAVHTQKDDKFLQQTHGS